MDKKSIIIFRPVNKRTIKAVCSYDLDGWMRDLLTQFFDTAFSKAAIIRGRNTIEYEVFANSVEVVDWFWFVVKKMSQEDVANSQPINYN